MTVDAPTADVVTTSATAPLADVRSDPQVRAGALAWDSPDVVTGWHRHPYHQIEYAVRGVAEVETTDGMYLLPPQQAIWIPADLPHSTTLRGVSSVSVFFHADAVAGDVDRARVLAAGPLLRELIRYALRWPVDRAHVDDEAADLYFASFASLVAGWLDDELPYWLPTSSDPIVHAAMVATSDRLATASMAGICASVGAGERTLRRRFMAETGMSWRSYLVQARLLRAMTLLTSTDSGVLAIATAVGFDSPSGFTRAFRTLTGTTPGDYRAQRAP